MWHGDAKERELHNEFEHLCRFAAYMRGAEWFNPAPELLARIEQIATKPEALQLPRYFSSVETVVLDPLPGLNS